MGKLSVKTIPLKYLATLRNRSNGRDKISVRDCLTQVGVPLLLGVVSCSLGFRLQGISNLISGVAIVSALLGAVSVFLFQTRMHLYDMMHPIYADTHGTQGTIFDDEDLKVIDELFYSVLWCILEGAFICAVLIGCDCSGIVDSGEYRLLWAFISCVVSMAACNLVLVLLMCLKRMARIYERFGMHKSKDSLS